MNRDGYLQQARLLADSFSDEIEIGASRRDRGPGGQHAGLPDWAARIQPSATDEIRRFLRELSDLLSRAAAPVLRTYCAFAVTPGGCRGELGLCGDSTVCDEHYERMLEIQLEAARRRGNKSRGELRGGIRHLVYGSPASDSIEEHDVGAVVASDKGEQRGTVDRVGSGEVEQSDGALVGVEVGSATDGAAFREESLDGDELATGKANSGHDERLSREDLSLARWCALTVSKGYQAGDDGKDAAYILYKKLDCFLDDSVKLEEDLGSRDPSLDAPRLGRRREARQRYEAAVSPDVRASELFKCPHCGADDVGDINPGRCGICGRHREET